MILTVITLITALLIAGVAAWFSIAGLMAIFTAAPIAILIMGTVLELGKLTSASWLYRNWDEIPLLLKSYLTGAVVVLMLITSMGIFGFLSKAHIDQGASVGNNAAKIVRLEKKIDYKQSQIVDFDKIIKQLDVVVETLVEYDKISGETGAIAVRRQQKSERDGLSVEISRTQVNIDEYEDEKAELSGKIREFELEVGPLKYIADMIYENPGTKLESAVRLVIIIIIFVFDPLAILLLIAANFSLKKNKKKDKTSLEKVNTVNEMGNGKGESVEKEESADKVNSGPQGEIRGEEVSPEKEVDWGCIREALKREPALHGPGEEDITETDVTASSKNSERMEERNKKNMQDVHLDESVPKDDDKITDNAVSVPIAKMRRWLNTGRRYYEAKD